MGQIAAAGISGGDEFTGPFPSWVNVKTAYGAVGDGVHDDTNALQTALNNAGVGGNPFVVYLPAGTYLIAAGLAINSTRQGIGIIGQDPANTTIKWGGPIGGEMLYLNGVSYSKFSRITWDGSNNALAAIDYGWDGLGAYGGSTNNENSDEVFKNLGFGIRGGSKGYMDGENSVLRCKFISNTRAGVSIENFNALDWYIWDSTFTNNAIGVTNALNGTAGHFHVYGSLFQNSSVADIEIGPVSYFGIRQNFSVGSNAFFVGQAVGSASADITFQSNTILDSITTPISVGNPGTVLMFDNVIRMAPNQSGPAVVIQDTFSGSPGGLAAVGNSVGYSANSAAWYSVPPGSGNVPGSVVDLNNSVVSRGNLNPAVPAMPGALPNLNRMIFEVPAGANADGIQLAIDSAVAYNGQRPVVHLPFGTFAVDHTLVIPVGSDAQLIGDGGGASGATNLRWVGSGGGPVLRLAGPSRAALRDFNIQGGGAGTGILVDNADQVNSRVFLEQLDSQRQSQAGLLVNGLDNAEVMLHDGYIVYNNVGLQVAGGPKAAAGQATAAKTDMFGALTASNTLSYNVVNHGRLMSQDVWYEGAPAQLFSLTDAGTFTLHGAHVAAQDPNHGGTQQPVPTMQVNNFNGSVSVLGAQLAKWNTFGVQGNGASTSMLALGVLGPFDNSNFFVNTTSPGGQVAMFASRQETPSAGSIPVADVAYNLPSGSAAFLLRMIAQTRQEQAHSLPALPAGITDARFYRVSIDQGQTGVELDAGGPASTSAATISGVSSSLNGSSVTISWSTNEAADSQVYYGTGASYGLTSVLNSSNVTAHSVTLSGILPGTQYHFLVRSRSLSGYLATSPDFTFSTPGSSAPASFVTGFNAGAALNNADAWVGMRFTVGAAVPVVGTLGRLCVSGNGGTHTVKLVRVTDGMDVAGGSATIAMSGCAAGSFQYGQLASPVSLSANTTYDLVSRESNGGDQWLNLTGVTTSAIGAVAGAATLGYPLVPGGSIYGPVDFTYTVAAADTIPPAVSLSAPANGASVSGQNVVLAANASDNVGVAWVQFKLDGNNLGLPVFASPYSLAWDSTAASNGPHTLSAVAGDAAGNTAATPAASITVLNANGPGTPLVTAATLLSARNNYTGYVGFQFTVGAKAISVGSLGRIYVAGNSGTHILKLVRAGDGVDVPGATATLTFPQGTAGQFAYAQLGSPITLPAGGAYILVSQETSGGDQWYDYNYITAANVVTVNGPIYLAGGGYVLVSGAANESFVPVSLSYTVPGGGAPTVSITSPAASATVLGALAIQAAASAPAGASISRVQFQVDGSANIGTPVTSLPYSVTLDTATLANGPHTLTAVATDSNGGTAVSPGVSVTVSNIVSPRAAITVPSQNSTVSGSITLAASASAAPGLTLASLQFKLDGTNFGSALASPPYSTLLDSTAIANGTHALSAMVTDSAGNRASSATVAFTSMNANAPGPFIVGNSLATLRNNFSGFLGMEITVGGAPISVYALGRMFLSGNLAAHTVKLVRAGDGGDVPGAAVTVVGGTARQFTYAQLASPVILPANTAYFLVSLESSGGDQWYDYGPVSPTAAAAVNGAVYANGTGGWTVINIPNDSFVPVGFLYMAPSANTAVVMTAPASNSTVSGTNVILSASVAPGSGLAVVGVQFKLDGGNVGAARTVAPYSIAFDSTALPNGPHSVSAVVTDSVGASTASPPVGFTVGNASGQGSPLVTGFTATALRNNYSGWVGMQITVGASPITVTSLGRIHVAGNSATHAVKLVRASDNTDVPGASVTVSPAVGAAGQFAYAPLASPVTLPANGSYHLVSQETGGGDQWYESGPVSAGNVAAVNSAVYWNGAVYVPVGIANYSYVPVNLLYTIVSAPPTVSITAPGPGATVSGNAVTVAAAAAGPAAGVTIAGVQFEVDGVNQGAAVAASPYAITLDATKLANGPHALTAIALDSAGNTTTSAAVSVTVNNAPAVAITAPVAGAAISGSGVAVGATAVPVAGLTIAGVQFKVDGVNQGAAVAASPYAITLDTTKLANGPHALTALALDSAGNTTTSAAVSVTVNNAPAVSITAPVAGSAISGPGVAVNAAAVPVAGLTIASVQFKVDGVNQGAAVAASPYAITLDTTKLANGPHALTAIALDSAGNSTASAAVSVTVSNSVTSVSITSPAAGAMVSGNNVSVAGAASAGTGLTIASVQFKVDGVNLGAPGTASPYSAVLDTTKLTAGAHTLTAAALDSGGAVTTSGPLVIVVNNAPSVSITAPASGSALSGNVNVTAMASAVAGLSLTGVQFQVDAVNWGPVRATPPYSVTLDTTALAAGNHVLSAIAADSGGNTAISAAVTIAVNNCVGSPPAAFIAGFNPGPARNNYSGYVGMQFTVGLAPLTVVSLGRLYLAGNTGSHTLKLARAVDGADVPGGSVTVTLPSGTAGQFAYATLPSPVTLAASTSYYLVSLESAGGDQWYDYSGMTPASVASVDRPVYFAGSGYNLVPAPGYSYVPVSFLYGNGSCGAPPTISLTAPADNASVSGSNVTLTAAASAAGGLTIASVQFKVDGVNLGAPVLASPYNATLDTTRLSNGAHSLTALAVDSAGNSAASAAVGIIVNNTPSTVAIASPSAGASISGSSAAVSATAAAGAGLSITSVQFKVDGVNQGAALTSLPYDITLDTTKFSNGPHVLTATALDSGGNSVTSTGVSVSVSNRITAAITAPAGGAVISGNSVTLSAVATPGAGQTITSVQFKVDGVNQGAAPTSLPYNITLDTTKFGNGPHVLTATALDSGGNSATSGAVSVTISNSSLAITAPAGGAAVLGNNVLVTASATPGAGLGILIVQFKVDGVYQGTALSSTPYGIALDSTKLSNASHTLSAVALDSGGTTVTSAPVGITVNNVPVAAITAPAAGATVSGAAVVVSGTGVAATGLAITSVQFKVDGVNIGSAKTAAPYSAALDSTTLSSGTHTLTAVATDSAGNVGTSPGVSVIVSVPAPGAASPLVTAFTAVNPRNNYGGWVGMQFTVGPAAINVSSLGRLFLAGNSGTHVIKLVRASDGQDVPGASAAISLSAGTAGQFTYSQLANPVTLAANTSYYLVSGETIGGDRFYDMGAVTAANAVSVNGAVYWSASSGYVSLGVPNNSYVPVNLSFAPVSSQPPAVSITAPVAGSAISGPGVAVNAAAVPVAGLTIASVQFKVDGVNQGAAVSSSPYAITFDTTKLANGPHALTALAVDSAGNSAISAAVSVTVSNSVTSVSIISPAAGAAVTGNNVSVAAAASAGTGLTISSVQFKVDGVNLGAPDTASPYSAVLDTTKLTAGAHTLTAAALDSGGTVTTSGPLAIVVNNAPSVSITAPASGSALSGSVNVTALASAVAGLSLTGVQFQVDSVNWGPVRATPPYSVTLDTTALAAGNHVLSAMATDSGGNTAISAAVTIAVNNCVGSAPAAFVSGFNPGPARNNYSGYVGMQFTVGSAPLTIASLGRLYLAGNTGSHTVKLARAADGADVPGGAATITLPSGTAGQFAYAALPSPVTLSANTSYYLVSLESAGGDQWYDYSAVTPASAAVASVAVDRPVYFAGSGYNLVPAPGYSYVPVSFLYGNGSCSAPPAASPSTVALTSPAPGASISGGSVAVSATATPGTGLSITSVQFKVDGVNQGAALNSLPYGITLDTAKFGNGTHVFTATALDSGGNSATSSGVTVIINNPVTAVSITSPAAGALISGGAVTVSAAATAAAGLTITSVQFKVDGVNIGSAKTAAPYSATLDSTTLASGAHSLTAIAADSAGNIVTSAGVNVSISNPSPLVTAFTAVNPRNNYGGWVGMQFTVGPVAVNVSSLGRLFLAGNSGTHMVKLVLAGDGQDVPGASAAISLSAGTAGQFTYSQLANPVTLTANTSYYLVSGETIGGDRFYDMGAVTAANAVSVNGAVYWSASSGYVSLGSPNNSYVPVSLLFAPVSAGELGQGNVSQPYTSRAAKLAGGECCRSR